MTPSVYKSVASTLKLSWCINFILVLSIRFYFGSLDVSLTVMVQSEITIKENWTTKKTREWTEYAREQHRTEESRKEQNRTEQQRVRERMRKKWRTKCIYQPWLLLLLAYIIVYIFIYFYFFLNPGRFAIYSNDSCSTFRKWLKQHSNVWTWILLIFLLVL